MAALDFPSSPTNGQVYGQYVYDSTKGAWRVSADLLASAIPSPTAPTNPVSGDLWFNTNDGVMFMYFNDGNTSQWVEVKSNTASGSTVAARVDAIEAKPSGLVQVIPATVAVGSGTATVGSSGNISFSSATNLSLNGVFTSTHRNYKVFVTFTAFSANPTTIEYRLRTNGVDQAAGTNYAGGQRIAQNGGLGAFYNSATTTMYASTGASSYPNVTAFSTDIAQPFTTGTSTTMVTTGSGFDGSVTFGYYFGGVQATAASYDGLTMLCGTGNFTGNIQVYGYRS